MDRPTGCGGRCEVTRLPGRARWRARWVILGAHSATEMTHPVEPTSSVLPLAGLAGGGPGRRRGGERAAPNKKGPPRGAALVKNGGDLLSQGREAQVPSALRGLTALFGMGRGVAPSLSPPKVVSDQAPPPELENCTAWPPTTRTRRSAGNGGSKYPSSPRTISTGLLSALLCLHIRPITWWSSRGLTPSRGWESSSRGRLPA
jgi:hypothetical protein